MRHYEKILIWENKRRILRLEEFRSLIVEYFNNSHVYRRAEERTEEPNAQVARVKIHRSMEEIHKIIVFSNINPLIIWSPPPMIGGNTKHIYPIQNFFNLHRFDLGCNDILGFVDRSIGIYELNQSAALIRTLNPFFYIGRLIEWIVELPFLALAKLGLDRGRAESSILGKFIKGMLYLITVIAALLTTLQLLGYLDPVKVFLDGLIK